jgi:four helix bundle protein
MVKQGYRDLTVYQRAYKAALAIHRLTLKFPARGASELIDQIRRSSKSIAANLVEGYSRGKMSKRAVMPFLVNALGSCDETKMWLEFARDLGYVDDGVSSKAIAEYEEIGKMIHQMLKRLVKTE